MNAIKRLMLGVAIIATVLAPAYNASAWDRGGGGVPRGNWSGGHGGHWTGGHGGHWTGGHPHGYWGGSRGYWGGPRGYYWGGPRGYYWGGGCWNCDAAGAAVAGLAVGTIFGAAIANSAPPPVDYAEPSAPLPREGCSSIVVQGITYYNCGDRDYDDDGYASGTYQGRANNSGTYQGRANNSGTYQGRANNSGPDYGRTDSGEADYSGIDNSDIDNSDGWSGK